MKDYNMGEVLCQNRLNLSYLHTRFWKECFYSIELLLCFLQSLSGFEGVGNICKREKSIPIMEICQHLRIHSISHSYIYIYISTLVVNKQIFITTFREAQRSMVLGREKTRNTSMGWLGTKMSPRVVDSTLWKMR